MNHPSSLIFDSKFILKLVFACLAGGLGLLVAATAHAKDFHPTGHNPNYQYVVWPDGTPDGCPFPRSTEWKRVVQTGRWSVYTEADTWYPSWSDDGHLYSGFTDGSFEGRGVANEFGVGGVCRIEGDDPMNLNFEDLGSIKGDRGYPCVNIVVNGTWYYGFYDARPSDKYFTGMNYSIDPKAFTTFPAGKFWEYKLSPDRNFFSEPGPAKFRTPHAVDFGKNNEHAPGGYIYIVSQGATDPKNPNTWCTGDQIYFARVLPTSPAAVVTAANWEFWNGKDWVKGVQNAAPVLAWDKQLGNVTVTYNQPLNKYLMVFSRINERGPCKMYFLEADALTGPYRLIQCYAGFGPETYFVCIPSKFISRDGKKFWICTSANYKTGPTTPGSAYACNFHELVLDDGSLPELPKPNGQNIAPAANITVSSVRDGYSTAALTDGVAAGYPLFPQHEWASNGEQTGAWVNLEWKAPQTISRVRIYDRPNYIDRAAEGTFTFSDGSSVKHYIWPTNNGSLPVELSFPPKTVTWVRYTVDKVQAGTMETGLSEIQVFNTTGITPDETVVTSPLPIPDKVEFYQFTKRDIRGLEADYYVVSDPKQAYSPRRRRDSGWVAPFDGSIAIVRDDEHLRPVRGNYAKGTGANTWRRDLANGHYQVKVIMGARSQRMDNVVLKINDKIVDGEINTVPGQWYEKTFPVEVTDDSLRLEFSDAGGATKQWMVNAIEIRQAPAK